ncbi:hypothetical protein [Falsiroseomonas sp.]|uniref:hypothetical protein n=1 Tax=Falsiroseomonas sp. TaxID=2870721 RepID=UPI003F7263F1
MTVAFYGSSLLYLQTGQRANLAERERHARFRFVHHDVCDPVEAAQPVDEVYNLACPASPQQYQADPGRAEALLGWRPEVALKDGLQPAIAWLAALQNRPAPAELVAALPPAA